MNKILGVIVLAIALLVVLFYAFNSYIYNEKQGDGLPENPHDALFTLRGEPVGLHEGVLTYFGNDVTQDVDGDGDGDRAFLVTEEVAGGSTWFYVVAALQSGNGYEGSQAVLLGADIAPQTTEVGEGRMVVVNYVERMSDGSSVGKSVHLLLDVTTREFGEVVQNFEGEHATPEPLGTCYVGGCSSQLCSDTPKLASTCEYHEAYACYQTAVCERQASGACGWTQSAELAACLSNAN